MSISSRWNTKYWFSHVSYYFKSQYLTCHISKYCCFQSKAEYAPKSSLGATQGTKGHHNASSSRLPHCSGPHELERSIFLFPKPHRRFFSPKTSLKLPMTLKLKHSMLYLSRDRLGHRDIPEMFRGQRTKGEEDSSLHPTPPPFFFFLFFLVFIKKTICFKQIALGLTVYNYI